MKDQRTPIQDTTQASIAGVLTLGIAASAGSAIAADDAAAKEKVFGLSKAAMLRFFRYFLLLPLFFAATAFPAERAFDQTGVDALQKQKKPLLVGIHADWCSTCKAQEPVIEELLKSPEFQSITALRVDYDKQKKIVEAFKAQYQSTLIVFKDGKEAGRSTGDTDKDVIAALLKKAL